MENDKKVVPICNVCKFLDRSSILIPMSCTHPDVPINNHLMGWKLCQGINGHGQCKLYKNRYSREEETKSSLGSITVDLTLNTEPFKKKMAELLAGL